jgi:hypothetical protein
MNKNEKSSDEYGRKLMDEMGYEYFNFEWSKSFKHRLINLSGEGIKTNEEKWNRGKYKAESGGTRGWKCVQSDKGINPDSKFYLRV